MTAPNGTNRGQKRVNVVLKQFRADSNHLQQSQQNTNQLEFTSGIPTPNSQGGFLSTADDAPKSGATMMHGSKPPFFVSSERSTSIGVKSGYYERSRRRRLSNSQFTSTKKTTEYVATPLIHSSRTIMQN